MKGFLSGLLFVCLALGIAIPAAAEDAFVNGYQCEGEGPAPKKERIKKTFFGIAESGDGYALNAMFHGRAYSGFGVGRVNKAGRSVISFALTDAKGEGTVSGVLRQAKDPQGHVIKGVVSVVYSTMRNYKDYDTGLGRLMCHASSAG